MTRDTAEVFRTEAGIELRILLVIEKQQNAVLFRELAFTWMRLRQSVHRIRNENVRTKSTESEGGIVVVRVWC